MSMENVTQRLWILVLHAIEDFSNDEDEEEVADDNDSINSFIFTILFVKPTKKE